MALPPEDLHAREDDGGVRGLRLREDGGDPGPGRRDRRRTRRRPQRLKAWYRQLCKRPCFHDEYLQAFNEPGTHLVDTDGKGVERITETGVVAAGGEYEVDCIIYASGFEVGTEYTRRAGFDPIGRDGVRCRSTGPRACARCTASTCTASPTCSSSSRPRAPT